METRELLATREITRVTQEASWARSGEPHQEVIVTRPLGNITPRGRKMLKGVTRVLHTFEHMDPERVDRIIDSPTTTWPGWNGATVYADDQFQVVLGQPWNGFDYVLHVAPLAEAPEPPTQQPAPEQEPKRRVSGQKADNRRPVPTSVPELLDRAQEYGFTVDASRRHYSISHPSRPGVSASVPRTPSDHRWAENQVSQIRRAFGIDLRKPLD